MRFVLIVFFLPHIFHQKIVLHLQGDFFVYYVSLRGGHKCYYIRREESVDNLSMRKDQRKDGHHGNAENN